MGNVFGRFSFLRARLCAGSPRLFVILTLAAPIISERAGADEPVKLAMVTQETTASTNTAKALIKVATPNTNSFTASFNQHSAAVPAATALHPADSDSSPVTVAVLIKKRSESTGLFSGQPGNGNFGFANIEAGYGQAYDCDSAVLRGNNGTTMEETRYIFFKKVVKF